MAFEQKLLKIPEIEIVAIIPTKNRPEKLNRALNSVEGQTLKPKIVLVINDCRTKDYFKETETVIDLYRKKIDIISIRNQRILNLSGAINTGIFFLLDKGFSYNQTYTAFLDDDDWWENTYLMECLNYLSTNRIDWVISGLIRHDESNPDGIMQEIPDHIDTNDFFVSNPNIQGSNLFIRFGKLLEINGFDENLVSTTDRDVCIRLLESKDITYGFLKKHLVHHLAFRNEYRLSTPRSEYKKKGLLQFYDKYKTRMSEDQKFLFKQRALDLFKVEIREDQ